MATLLFSEARVEARDNKQGLFVASLDARKAFHVVDHSLMKLKLYQTSLPKKLWAVIDDVYLGGQECVRWEGLDSTFYTVEQGVKQGAIMSPT